MVEGERKGWKLPARVGAGDKQLHGFHGSTRRAKSALISGSRACRKRDDARRTVFSERTEDKEETGKKGIESKIRIRRRSYGALRVRAERKKKKRGKMAG